MLYFNIYLFFLIRKSFFQIFILTELTIFARLRERGEFFYLDAQFTSQV